MPAGAHPIRIARNPSGARRLRLARFVTRALVVAALPALFACPRMEARRPNVLVVVVDTLRADHLSFYGYPVETAPFLAAQAARSVVFENAWSTSSWTAPAAASLFTGVYPVEHGVHLGVNAVEMLQRGGAKVTLDRVPDALETLPELMRGLGYRTFGVSDNPNVSEAQGFAAGFDRFENYDYAGAPRVNASVEALLPEIGSAERWFVYLHYMDPHQPYHPRRRYLQRPRGADAHAASRAAYDSEIGWVDEHIRRAFELLRVDDATLVVFAADHGEEFGDHGGTSHRFKLYEELTRVPFFLRVPDLPPRRVTVPVSLVDLRPTLRALLGLPPSEQDSGVDLTPVMAAAGNAPAERALFASRTTGVGWKRARPSRK